MKIIKKLLKNKSSDKLMIAYLSFSNLISNVITIISGLFVAKWLLPSELGFFNGFALFSSYIILLQMGVPSALGREYPLFISKNDAQKAKTIAEVSHCYQLFLSLLILFISAIIAAYFVILGDYEYASGTIVVGITSFEVLYVGKYLQILYRSHNYFNKLSLINVLTSIGGGVSIFFVWKYGFYGLCIRSCIIFLINFYFTLLWKPVRIDLKWDWVVLKELLKVGMPIFWVSNLYSMWPNIQRTFVLTFFGTNALGLYALSTIVQSSMSIITNSLSTIVFPRMVVAYGEGKSIKDILHNHTKFIFGTFFINSTFCLLGWFLLPILVELFIPNYYEGISAARWMLLVGLFDVFGVYSNIYMVINKSFDRMISFLFGIIIWICTLYILSTMNGMSLEMVPQSMLIAYISIYFINFLHYKKYIL